MPAKKVRYAKKLAQRIDRRRFVKGMGVGLLAAPFLNLLLEEPVKAVAGPAKRIIFIVTNGTHIPSWKMNGSSDQEIVTNTWNSGLDRVKENLIVLENLDAGGGNHGAYHCMLPSGAWWADPTIDQVIATHLAAAGTTTSLPSLLLGSDMDDDSSYFRNKGSSVPTITQPQTALQLVFGDVGGSGQDEAALAAGLLRKQSIVDLVRNDLNELKGMLGSEERPKLEAHLDSLRQFEARLSGPAGGDACSPPSVVESGDPITIAKANMDIALATLTCDVSRVVGMQWGQHNRFGLNVPEIGLIDDIHSLHHNGNKMPQFEAYENWFSHQFADFVEAVANTPDPEFGGSLLDSTVIAWVRGMGDAVGHSSADSRLVLAGGPDIFKTSPNGRYLDCGGSAYKNGLATITEAFGVTSDLVAGGKAIDGLLA